MTSFVCSWLEDDPESHTLHHLHRIEVQLENLGEQMTSFASDQAHLDADVQSETANLTLIEQEIAALKAQPAAGALDFTGLDAAVARVKTDTPAPVTPPTPTPTPTPTPAPTPAPPSA